MTCDCPACRYGALLGEMKPPDANQRRWPWWVAMTDEEAAAIAKSNISLFNPVSPIGASLWQYWEEV